MDAKRIADLFARIRIEERRFNTLRSSDFGFADARDRLSALRSELARITQQTPNYVFQRAIVQRIVVLSLYQKLTTGEVVLVKSLVPRTNEFQRIVAKAILPANVWVENFTEVAQRDEATALGYYRSLLKSVNPELTVDVTVDLEPIEGLAPKERARR